MFWRNLDWRKPCKRAQRMLVDRSVGLLTPADQRRLDRHLASCPLCAHEAEVLARVLDLVDSVPPAVPPPHLWDGVCLRIRSAQPAASWQVWAPPLLAAGAVVVLVAGFALQGRDPLPHTLTAPPANSIAYIQTHALAAHPEPFADHVGLVSYVTLAERAEMQERRRGR